LRKLVAGLFMSLDGVVESPATWGSPYLDEEMQATIDAGIAQADAVLLGRRTYLEFAELWPKLGSGTPMAAFLNNAPKHVASTTLDTLSWANSRLVGGDLGKQVAALKRQPGRNILVPGSPRLVASLLRDALLDELTLGIAPIVVGAGRRLFEGPTDRMALQVVASKTLGSGVLSVTYRRA
jgi:dihydrofolate reductase